jgi:hypothetical protein
VTQKEQSVKKNCKTRKQQAPGGKLVGTEKLPEQFYFFAFDLSPQKMVQFPHLERVNEFYKKGCQEKTSPSTGGEKILVSRSSPLSVSSPDGDRGSWLWLVCPSCGVHLSVVTTPIES